MKPPLWIQVVVSTPDDGVVKRRVPVPDELLDGPEWRMIRWALDSGLFEDDDKELAIWISFSSEG